MKKFFLIPLLACSFCAMAWSATITVGEGGDQTTLAAAISAASAGDVLQLVSDVTVSSGVDFNKNLTVDFNSYTITATGNWLIAVNANLTLEATNGGGITAPKGCLDVYGSSKVTINGGTFTTSITNSGAAIWGNGSSCELEFNNGTINAQSAGIVYEGGRVIINGGNFNGEYGCALEVRGGYFEINDGEFISHCSTTHMGSNWAYAVIAANCTFVMNGGHIEGVQGGLSLESGANGTIRGGEFETKHGVDGKHNNHYALYVSTLAVVDVHGGKYKVETPSQGNDRVILIDDNDSGTTYGIINLYGGTFQQKAQVTHKQAHDAEMAFPTSIPATSQWYSSFGGYAPLPAGYEYYDITEGEDYEAGYRYGVRPVAGKEADAIDADQQAAQEADPTYTIPWQQATTWAEDEVPEENTIVTIPVGATVTVSKSEATKEAVADQVFVNQGATLKVEEGTTLTVGEGGMNIGFGGSIEVEAGAKVIIGDAGIISAKEDNIVLTSSEDNNSTLLLAPSVTENTQPLATYKFISKGRKISDGHYVWQRLGIPTFNGGTTMTWNADVQTALYDYDYEADDWHLIYAGDQPIEIEAADGRPFQCYKMTTDKNIDNVEYTFTGNLMGNDDATLEFVYGWNYYANSYTAPIDIKEFMTDIRNHYKELSETVSATVYVYNRATNWWDGVNLASLLIGSAPQTVIRPMQAFILELVEGESANSDINYETNVYNPVIEKLNANQAPKAQRTSDFNSVVISVTDGTNNDKITLFESPELSDEFDNGYDATKFSENNVFSIYSLQNDMKLTTLATNDLSDKFISFDATVAGEFTMSFSNVLGDEISLYDAVTDSVFVMKEGETYKFTAEAINDAERFIINKKDAPSAIEDVQNVMNITKFIGVDGQLYIRRSGKVYDVQGKEVK